MTTPKREPSLSRRRRRSRRSARARRRRYALLGLFAVLLIVAFGFFAHRFAGNATISAANWYETEAAQKPLVELPKDDAPHDASTEWWYYDGHLKTNDGHTYSYHFVVFVVESVVKFMVSHVSFTDHATGKHYQYQKRLNAPHEQQDKDGFELTAGNWEMARKDGQDRLKVETPVFSLALTLDGNSPPVLHGGTGLLDFREAGKSYYYSRTRMNSQGTLAYGGKSHSVTGQAWFDHQWGSFSTTLIQYDWFALQLRDGVEIMLYQLSDLKGKPVLNVGTYIENGKVEDLKEGDFASRPVSFWLSPATGIRYPVKWRIEIPRKNVDIVIAPVIEASEFDAHATTYNAYWEGAVVASGSHPGVGFLEVSRKN